jgi:predicted ATPase
VQITPSRSGGGPTTASTRPDDFVAALRSALRHLHDDRQLDRVPLAPRGATTRGRYGRALQAALREALVSLRPPSSGASLVALRYLDGLTPPMVFRRLGISRSEYYRQHDRCVAEMRAVRWTTTTGFATVPRGGPRPKRLIGRDEDMAAVRAILDEYRLVTISGPGGVGKTRLAFELADACQSDGAVTVIDLTDVPEAVRVAPTVAAAFGAREGATLKQALASGSEDAARLVVMDNCEHVAEGAAAAAAVLLEYSAARILATSREPLRVPGERIYALQPLAAPAAEASIKASDALSYAAVRLFVERAAAADRGFELTEANTSAVAELCRLLDGMPLALELAAACVPAFTPAQLVGMLDARFALLVDGPRTAPPRHRTLRAAVAWSADLLEPTERTVLRRLAVFVGGWTADAAVAVCHCDTVTETDVLAALARLVRASLVIAESLPTGERGYRMLETIRRFAYDELIEEGDEYALRDRHLEWYAEFAAAAQRVLPWGDDGTWLDRVGRELANVRAALSWARASSNAEFGLRVASGLTEFWYQRGLPAEGLAWIETWLGAQVPSDLRARALLGAATTATRVGRMDAVTAYAGECLRDYPTCNWPRAAMFVAYAATTRGDLEEARSTLQREFARVPAHNAARADLFHGLGRLENAAGNYTASRAYHDEALTIYREAGNLFGQQSVLLHGACSSIGLGEYDHARLELAECLAINRRMGNLHAIPLVESMVGVVALFAGDVDQARLHLVNGLYGYRRAAGEVRYLSWVLGAWAEVVLHDGDARSAATLLGAAKAVQALVFDVPLPVLDVRRKNVAEATRAALRHEHFESAWRSGASMSLASAINLGAGTRSSA